jgi:uncharacterized protein YcfJ
MGYNRPIDETLQHKYRRARDAYALGGALAGGGLGYRVGGLIGRGGIAARALGTVLGGIGGGFSAVSAFTPKHMQEARDYREAMHERPYGVHPAVGAPVPVRADRLKISPDNLAAQQQWGVEF